MTNTQYPVISITPICYSKMQTQGQHTWNGSPQPSLLAPQTRVGLDASQACWRAAQPHTNAGHTAGSKAPAYERACHWTSWRAAGSKAKYKLIPTTNETPSACEWGRPVWKYIWLSITSSECHPGLPASLWMESSSQRRCRGENQTWKQVPKTHKKLDLSFSYRLAWLYQHLFFPYS